VVYSEGALTGERRITSRAHVTFVTLAADGVRAKVPPLLLETDEDRAVEAAARQRHAAHLARRSAR